MEKYIELKQSSNPKSFMFQNKIHTPKTYTVSIVSGNTKIFTKPKLGYGVPEELNEVKAREWASEVANALGLDVIES